MYRPDEERSQNSNDNGEKDRTKGLVLSDVL